MIKVKETIFPNKIKIQGNPIDVITYLEREQERCGKISVLEYIRLRKIETSIDKQFGVKDMRRGYENVLQ